MTQQDAIGLALNYLSSCLKYGAKNGDINSSNEDDEDDNFKLFDVKVLNHGVKDDDDDEPWEIEIVMLDEFYVYEDDLCGEKIEVTIKTESFH